jgi:hypothetical protein
MITKSSQGGHSARVNMRLLVGERSVPVVQLGPDFLLVGEPVDLPPGEASMVMQVDGSESRWRVFLPDGISAATNRVAIMAAA